MKDRQTDRQTWYIFMLFSCLFFVRLGVILHYRDQGGHDHAVQDSNWKTDLLKSLNYLVFRQDIVHWTQKGNSNCVSNAAVTLKAGWMLTVSALSNYQYLSAFIMHFILIYVFLFITTQSNFYIFSSPSLCAIPFVNLQIRK